MTDEYQIDNVTWAQKDSNGDIVVDTDSLNTPEFNTRKYADPADGISGIQTIIDNHAPGVTIYLEPDSDYVGSGLELDDQVEIIGSFQQKGNVCARLKLADGANEDLVQQKGDPDDRNVSGNVFRGVVFDGNKPNNSSGNAVAAAFYNSRFINCKFYNAVGNGLWIKGSSNASNDDNVTISCRFNSNNNYGLQIGKNLTTDPSAFVSRHYFPIVGGNGDTGIRVKGQDHVIYAPKLFANGTVANSTSVLFEECSLCGIIGGQVGGQDTSTNGVVFKAQNGINSIFNYLQNVNFVNQQDSMVQAFADGDNIEGLRIANCDFWSAKDGGSDSVKGVEAFGSGSFSDCVIRGCSFKGNFQTAALDLDTGWRRQLNQGILEPTEVNRFSVDDSGVEDLGTISSGDTASTTVSFDTDFDSRPVVVVTQGDTGGSAFDSSAIADNISTSSFRLGVKNTSANSSSFNHVSWIAFEQP